MPELPEVETVAAGIGRETKGRKILRALTTRKDIRYPFPDNLCTILKNKTVNEVYRRAKYILINLSGGKTLIIHLGMTGRVLFYDTSSYKPKKHDHFIIDFDNGKSLVLNDARRFGFVDIAETGKTDENPHLKSLGYEPFDKKLDAGLFYSILQKRSGPIKTVLLDQGNVVGVGNIYACEALFRTGIHPEKRADSVSLKTADILLKHIRDILNEAIKAGGSTLRDYTAADGTLGRFQLSFGVYGREGMPCANKKCRGTVTRITQAGRSTFYCPSCQKKA